MLSVTDSNFDEVINSKQLTLIDFFASWCRPCHAFHPILEDVAKQLPDVQFYTLNVDENKATPTKYFISAIPTLLLFKEGQEVKRIVGIQDSKTLTETLRTLKG